MKLYSLKAGMILKNKISFKNEDPVFEKGTILTSEHINLLEKSGLSEFDVISLPDIANEYERQIYQSYINLDLCFSGFDAVEDMANLKKDVKKFIFDYLDSLGGNTSNG